MPLSREHRAVPQFDVGYTAPPSRPRLNPPPRTAAVKSLPSHRDPTGGRQAGARPRSYPLGSRHSPWPEDRLLTVASTVASADRRRDGSSFSME
jgi:hypothetical protein